MIQRRNLEEDLFDQLASPTQAKTNRSISDFGAKNPIGPYTLKLAGWNSSTQNAHQSININIYNGQKINKHQQASTHLNKRQYVRQ